MTTIYLMRHGHVDNHDAIFYGREFQLSERGRAQVRKVGEALKRDGVVLSEIIASPFTRTRQTAEILVGILDGSFSTDERLREWDVGPWFGKPLAEFYAATGYHDVPLRVDDPQVEPLEVMAERVMTVIDELRERVAGGSGFIVSHREPMVSAILRLQGLPWDTIHDVSFDPADVWCIEYADDGSFLMFKRKS